MHMEEPTEDIGSEMSIQRAIALCGELKRRSFMSSAVTHMYCSSPIRSDPKQGCNIVTTSRSHRQCVVPLNGLHFFEAADCCKYL